jgi:hypothetical protein
VLGNGYRYDVCDVDAANQLRSGFGHTMQRGTFPSLLTDYRTFQSARSGLVLELLWSGKRRRGASEGFTGVGHHDLRGNVQRWLP